MIMNGRIVKGAQHGPRYAFPADVDGIRISSAGSGGIASHGKRPNMARYMGKGRGLLQRPQQLGHDFRAHWLALHRDA